MPTSPRRIGPVRPSTSPRAPALAIAPWASGASAASAAARSTPPEASSSTAASSTATAKFDAIAAAAW